MIFRVWETGHVCHSPQQASSPVYISSPGASSSGDRCPITGPAVTTGICLEQQVVPSACMEALKLHYQPAVFSREVTKLAAASWRPSTNRMYDNRWLRFANWATGKRFDPLGPTAAQISPFLYELFDTQGLSPQTIKGYRSCLALVLSRTGKLSRLRLSQT